MKSLRILTMAFVALIAATALQAKQITATQALQIAQGFNQKSSLLKASNSMQLVYTQVLPDEAQGNAAFVFANENKRGFVIAAADDCSPAVLGYSDDSEFDPNNIPENMAAWLEEYAEQIAIASATGTQIQAGVCTAARPTIAPLCATKWNQYDPYNLFCPSYTVGTEQKKAVTGCVATSMAQMLKQSAGHPTKGQGSHTYEAKVGSGTQTLTADFGATTYEWDLMTNTYNSTSTEAERRAVATLMLHCGISVEMSYGSSSGAASSRVAHALATYFRYDKSIIYYDRVYFALNTWIDMLYGELAAGRSIIYNGRNKDAGHSFILDGFDPNQGGNYFHVNWGWGGLSDGYFLVTGLDPDSQGAGGSTSGYNQDQGAVFGAVADHGGDYTYKLAAVGPFKCNEASAQRISTVDLTFDFGTRTSSSGGNFPFSAFTAADAVECELGYCIYDPNTQQETFVSTGYNVSLPVGYMGNYQGAYQITPAKLTSGLSAGTYRLYPAIRKNGNVDHLMLGANGAPYINMEVTDETVKFSEVDTTPKITVTNPEVFSNLYADRKFSFSASFKNDGYEYSEDLHLRLKKSNLAVEQYITETFNITLSKGDSIAYSGFLTLPSDIPAGTYQLTICNSKDQVLSGGTIKSVKVAGTPDDPVLTSTIEVSETDINDLTVEGTITNTGGLFDYSLLAALYTADGSNVQQWTPVQVLCENGQTIPYVFQDDLSTILEAGKEYIAALFCSNGNTYVQLNRVNFFATSTSAIDVVDADAKEAIVLNLGGQIYVKAAAEIGSVSVITISGAEAAFVPVTTGYEATIDASNLPAGVYIVKVTTADGVFTKKILL